MAAAISLGAPEWAHGAANVEAIGAVETGVAVIGTAVIGVAETGMAAIGAAETGMAIGTIFVEIMSSSSLTSAFLGGGVGAGVRHGAGAIHTDTDIMALA